MTFLKIESAIRAAARIACDYAPGYRIEKFKSELLARGIDYDAERMYANQQLRLAVEEAERIRTLDFPDSYRRSSMAMLTAVRQ